MKATRQLIARGYAKAGDLYDQFGRNVAIGGMSVLGPVAAFAQTAGADPFDTAVTDIKEKIEGYGGALVGVAAVAVVFMVGMKFVKKIPKAA